jgi:hypothetical protein
MPTMSFSIRQVASAVTRVWMRALIDHSRVFSKKDRFGECTVVICGGHFSFLCLLIGQKGERRKKQRSPLLLAGLFDHHYQRG